MLELILGFPVGDLVCIEKQRPIEITPDGKGVRFDVYAKDDHSVVYDIEMQNRDRGDLPKRVRYSQSLIDLEMIERGSQYSELQKSYIIFICRFNLFPSFGLHKYSFQNTGEENNEIILRDGVKKIFICTKGHAEDVSERMKSFLAYVDEQETGDGFTERIEDAVRRAKANPGWRKEYMDLKDYIDMEIEKERINTERERLRAENAEKKLRQQKWRPRSHRRNSGLPNRKSRGSGMPLRENDSVYFLMKGRGSALRVSGSHR